MVRLFEGNYAHDIFLCPCGIRKHLGSQLKTLNIVNIKCLELVQAVNLRVEAVTLSQWSTQDLHLNMKLLQPKQEYVFEGKMCEYFHTPVKAVIIKQWGDQHQALILLTLSCVSLSCGKTCLIVPDFSLSFHKKTQVECGRCKLCGNIFMEDSFTFKEDIVTVETLCGFVLVLSFFKVEH